MALLCCLLRKISQNCLVMRKVLVVLFVFISFNSVAQQDALLNQYMFNKTLVNPAYTGTLESVSLVALHREQWVSMPGAPKTSSISIHAPIGYNMGVGGYIMRDEIGPLEDTKIMISYAYHLRLSSATLSLGVQFGGKFSQFNYNELNFKDCNERLNIEGNDKEFVPDANLGVYLYGANYYVGASTKQLMNNKFGLIENDGVSTYSRLDRHYYLMGGYVFPFTDNIMCRPSTLVKYVKNAKPQVDLNVSFLLNNVLWLGTSYRTGNQVALMAELNVSNQLSVGYSFDMPMTSYGVHTNGTHEVILSYNFNMYKKRRMSPRYF